MPTFRSLKKWIFDRHFSWCLNQFSSNQLIALDYQVDPRPRFKYGKPAHPKLELTFERSKSNFSAWISAIVKHSADPRIRYFRLTRNAGHLGALKFGAQQAASDWIALLDADDELTPNSIEVRVMAAISYEKITGVKPQLIYGDLNEGTKFTRLKGYSFPYLCKELSLCQTSTIMLGKQCIPNIPVKDTYNTDDELVLSIGQNHHILHSGETVAIYHSHSSPTRMSKRRQKNIRGCI